MNFRIVLAAIAFVLLPSVAMAAQTIQIPAQGATGQCSNGPTTQASFSATVDSPGVKGIYLLPQDDYNKLVNASQSSTPQNVQFQYYIQFSCATGNVTSCKKNTGNTVLPNNVTCVAFVNELNSTLTGSLNVNFNSNQPLSGAGRLASGFGVLVSIASMMFLGLF